MPIIVNCKEVIYLDKVVYHGGYSIVESPEIRVSRYTKDFSWGFYCTEIKEQAERWAGRLMTPVVNVYRVKNIDNLSVLTFKDYSDEWLEFVVACRSGETHLYDVVIGPMADDTIYDYIEAYRDGQMDKDLFFELMRFKYPTHQISFHTIKALSQLEFVESYSVPRILSKKLNKK